MLLVSMVGLYTDWCSVDKPNRDTVVLGQVINFHLVVPTDPVRPLDTPRGCAVVAHRWTHINECHYPWWGRGGRGVRGW